MWFKMVSRDLNWAAKTDRKITNTITLPASPQRVFSILADMEQTPLWFKEIEGGCWNSTQTHCVHAERTVHLDILSVREIFLAWEEGRRFAFSITESTLPLAVSIVEDYRLSPDKNGHTCLEWDVVYQLRWFVVPFNFLVVLIFGRMFRRAAQGLVEYVSEKSS